MRFGTGQEPRVDFVHISDPAPQAFEDHRAIVAQRCAPPGFTVACTQSSGGTGQRGGQRFSRQSGFEGADQRHLFDNPAIIAARNEGQQVLQSQRLIHQRAQIRSAACAVCGFQHPAL